MKESKRKKKSVSNSTQEPQLVLEPDFGHNLVNAALLQINLKKSQNF